MSHKQFAYYGIEGFGGPAETITVTPFQGQSLEECTALAFDLAAKSKKPVRFIFEGREYTIDATQESQS